MPGLLIWIAGGIALAVLLGLIALWATGRFARAPARQARAGTAGGRARRWTRC